MGLSAAVLFKMLVCVLHQNHRRIHHDSDGNGDASQTHNVGVDAQKIHDEKRHQNAHRQGEDGHKGRSEVEEENNTDHGHHAHFLNELCFERVDASLDKS